MPNLKPYTGPTKLVVAFDIGTTYSGISYCILERGQVLEILGVTRQVFHFFVSSGLTGPRFPSQAQTGGDAKVPSLLYYDKTGNVRAAGAEVLTENVLEDALTEEWTKAEWLVINDIKAFVGLILIQVEASPPPEAFSFNY
jgi:molecular chaperone DnaK (HSP70)